MTKIAIIIPSRLDAQRLPNKPLKLIKEKEMILHVYDLAVKADVGDVIVATPDKKIYDKIKSYNGNAVITKMEHQTGTDRIFEVFQKELKKQPNIIINLQGDMPNLSPSSIKDLINYMKKKTCNIGTLASNIKSNKEIIDQNICKVVTKKNISQGSYSNATDFYRLSKEEIPDLTYHHVGIYAFTNEALTKYVSLKRSKLEIKRKLEQLRALENKMTIAVGHINACPLSVDTEKDLIEIKKIMEN
jgi:3-deoxy-manno-octulosonate cytidylyltransferase (CMP-KDO synthetase)